MDWDIVWKTFIITITIILLCRHFYYRGYRDGGKFILEQWRRFNRKMEEQRRDNNNK